MTRLENYLQDGANYQARATLMFLQRNANIESSWNKECKCYDAEIKVARWENCREQGYIVSLCSKKFGGGEQLNIAFFEHRNCDNICAVKWEQNSINSITINDAETPSNVPYNNKGIDIQYEYFVHDFNNVKQLDENPIFTKEGDTDYEGFIAYKGKNPVTIYGDTDSVHNQTVINVYGENIIVEDWYNKNIKNGSAGVTLKGHESVKTDDKILNWSEDEGLYYVPVKRIIRHKVSKEKWKLKTKSGKEIIVTNDHSMIVFRNDKKIEIKPRDILKLDKILAINELPLN